MFRESQLQIIGKYFSAITEEMALRLRLSAFSPNIRDRRDLSCALFDSNGLLVTQSETIPAHLGPGIQMTLQSLLKNADEILHSDVLITNDPFTGSSNHLPDVTLASPIFYNSAPIGYVACRAHHADIGGSSPGSMGSSVTEIYQEGLRIPFEKIREEGKINNYFLNLIMANTREGRARKSDLLAQVAALDTGIIRLSELIEKKTVERVGEAMKGVQTSAKLLMEKAIEKVGDIDIQGEDWVEDDGLAENMHKLHLNLQIKGKELSLDFAGSANQAKGSINTAKSLALAGCFFGIKAVIAPKVPPNAGSFSPIQINLPKGSILNPNQPSPVAAGNETAQRVVDVILLCFSKILPEIPAASNGAMTDTTLGGISSGKAWSFYETIGGGSGATAIHDGVDGVHCYLTNTFNTPVEVIERTYPFRIRRYELIPNTGGQGKYRGGLGILREYEAVEECRFAVLGERNKIGPWGLKGGKSGRTGQIFTVIDGIQLKASLSKFHGILKPKNILRIETAGGGGFGNPEERIIELKRYDKLDGKIT
ncbi:MAG: hydantoinase B/oxoprolinase family protein [Promethearchaeota archaeon]